MTVFMGEKDLLLGHMDDLASRAIKNGCAASKFLTPAEAQSVTAYFKHRSDVALSFDGGFEGAERVRAVFRGPHWGECNRVGLFAVLAIAYRPQNTLGHRDILGALMALGVERDTFGDILAVNQPAMLVCLPELGKYITENLTKAGRVGVSVSKISLDDLPAKTEDFTIKTDTVASLRMDAVLGAAFGLSRTKAAELIAAGRVNLNYELCMQPVKELGVGALLSVRGLGRAKLLEIGGMSKKGRMFVRIGSFA